MRRIYQRLTNDLPADQAAQEAGTAPLVFVAPATQQYHQSAAKAWVHVLMSGAVPILVTGYNVGVVSGPAGGMHKIFFTNPVSSTFYAPLGTAITTSGGGGADAIYCTVGNLTSLSFVVYTRLAAGTLATTHLGINVQVFGDLP